MLSSNLYLHRKELLFYTKYEEPLHYTLNTREQDPNNTPTFHVWNVLLFFFFFFFFTTNKQASKFSKNLKQKLQWESREWIENNPHLFQTSLFCSRFPAYTYLALHFASFLIQPTLFIILYKSLKRFHFFSWVSFADKIQIVPTKCCTYIIKASFENVQFS